MSVSKTYEKKGLNWNYRCDRNPERNHKKIGKKKDYFCIQVKGNQKTLKEDIEDYFADKGFRKKLKEEGMYSRKTEKQRGRLETRKYYTILKKQNGLLKEKK